MQLQVDASPIREGCRAPAPSADNIILDRSELSCRAKRETSSCSPYIPPITDRVGADSLLPRESLWKFVLKDGIQIPRPEAVSPIREGCRAPAPSADRITDRSELHPVAVREAEACRTFSRGRSSHRQGRSSAGDLCIRDRDRPCFRCSSLGWFLRLESTRTRWFKAPWKLGSSPGSRCRLRSTATFKRGFSSSRRTTPMLYRC